MSRASARRRRIQWARYANHYAHHRRIAIGGRPVLGAIVAGGPWFHVRRQAKWVAR